MRIFSISTQLILSLIVLLGLSYNAHGKQEQSQTSYKVENCDCLGFSDDIPTFLSDLPGAENIVIEADGKSIDEVEKKAQNMCVETYRTYASTHPEKKTKESLSSVTQTGCQIFKASATGDWKSI